MVKVYIDLGHGGTDTGANGNGLSEKNVVLEIGKYMNDMLKNYEGIQWKFSRLTDKTLSLSQRTNEANAWGADLLVSIHINAFNGKADGFETFIYNGSYGGKARAQSFQNVLHQKIMATKFFGDRGKKQANYHMLRESNMTAVLTENGFIDSKKDAATLKDRAKIIQIAGAHVEGIATFAGLKKKAATSQPTTGNGELYKVQVGAFSNKANAEKLAKELKGKGYNPFITKS